VSAADPLVLASASPRRRDLLSRAGVRFEVRPAGIPEVRGEDEPFVEFARRLAREKAEAVARALGPTPRRWVLGADTIVVVGAEVLGKPADAEDAVGMLGKLVGRRHTVVTGVALVESEKLAAEVTSVESLVSLRGAEEDELRAYVATGEPLDKAGSYAFQGEGRRLVEKVEGSETNVIGLPMEETLALLERAGLRS